MCAGRGHPEQPEFLVLGTSQERCIPTCHHLLPTCSLFPLPPEIPHCIFHKAFNFYLRDRTLGLGLGRSACQAGCQWVLSLGDSEKSAPFSLPLTCGALKMKTQIEAIGLCSSPPP